MNKRMISVLLIVMMLFTVISPVYAAGDGYTITINNKAPGHTYEAYQIFNGDLSGDKLSNIGWGNGITEAGTQKLEEVYGAKGPVKVAEKVAEENNAKAFAITVSNYLQNPTKSEKGENVYTISGLDAGYYLVKDQDGTLQNQNDAHTDFIVNVVKSVTVTPKSSVPTVEKKVKDTNDSANTTTGWQDSADYDINDRVPFQLKATLGSNLSGYKTYKLVFHDTLSAGLTYDAKSMQVKVGDKDLTEDTDFTVVSSGTDLTVTINDVIVHNASAGSVVTAEYTATLNEKAVIGTQGNPNKVYLEYSNNPNGEGMGKTAEDKVVVFTYEVKVNKVDDQHQALEGAGFTLYKQGTDGKYVAVGNEVKGEAMTEFIWKGLDDGNYKLVETTTPSGFNTMKDLEFTITATHEPESADPQLTKVTGTDPFTVSNGILSADIVNHSGSVLPETGGMGTTIFYVLGGLLVVGAAVMLIARKRVNQ